MDKTMVNKETQRKKQLFVGEVISDKMNKTVVVQVTRTFTHPDFGKVLKKVKNYKVHDETEQASTGDVVEFVEGRPASKTKYMYLTRVVQKSEVEPLLNDAR